MFIMTKVQSDALFWPPEMSVFIHTHTHIHTQIIKNKIHPLKKQASVKENKEIESNLEVLYWQTHKIKMKCFTIFINCK